MGGRGQYTPGEILYNHHKYKMNNKVVNVIGDSDIREIGVADQGNGISYPVYGINGYDPKDAIAYKCTLVSDSAAHLLYFVYTPQA